jgi:Cu/Ag efflux protein CusF
MSRSRFHTVAFYSFFAWLVIVGGANCKREQHTTTSSSSKSYQAQGIVKAVHSEKRVVVIAHQDIPNFMKAMTMGFEDPNERWLKTVQKEDRVTFQFHEQNGHYLLDSLQKIP